MKLTIFIIHLLIAIAQTAPVPQDEKTGSVRNDNENTAAINTKNTIMPSDGENMAHNKNASGTEVVALPFRIDAVLHNLVDRPRRQYIIQQNNQWPNNQYRQTNDIYRSNDISYARKRADDKSYQDRLRDQYDNARRRLCNPRRQPVPIPQTRRNCRPRQAQVARQPITPLPRPPRRNCRQRVVPTYMPEVLQRTAVPFMNPTQKPQQRRLCHPRRVAPTYSPQMYNYHQVPKLLSITTERVKCHPTRPPPPVYRKKCIPRRLPRNRYTSKKQKEFQSDSDCISNVTSSSSTNQLTDCKGSVKVVSVNDAGVVEYYIYKTGKDVGEVFATFAANARKRFHEAAGRIEQISSKVADLTQNATADLTGTVGNVAVSAKDYAAHGLQKTGEALGEAGNVVKAAATEVAVKGAEGVDTAANAVVGAAHHTGEVVADVAGTVKNGTVSAANDVGDWLGNAAGAIKSGVVSAGETIGNAASSVVDAVHEEVRTAGQSISDATTNVYGSARDGFAAVGEAVDSAAHTVKKDASEASDQIADVSSSAWESTKNAGKAVSDTAAEIGSNAWDEVKNTGDKVVEGVQSAERTAEEGLKNVGERVQEKSKNVAQTVGNTAAEVWDHAKNAERTAEDTLVHTGSTAWEEFKESGKAIGDTAGKASSAVGGFVAEVASDTRNAVGNTLKSAGDSIKEEN